MQLSLISMLEIVRHSPYGPNNRVGVSLARLKQSCKWVSLQLTYGDDLQSDHLAGVRTTSRRRRLPSRGGGRRTDRFASCEIETRSDYESGRESAAAFGRPGKLDRPGRG